MIELSGLEMASATQMSCMNFALAYQLKKYATPKYAKLYKLAKDFLGTKNLIFRMDDWYRLLQKDGYKTAVGVYTKLLLRSLRSDGQGIHFLRLDFKFIQETLQGLIHESVVISHWNCVTADIQLAVTPYNDVIRQITAKFWVEEDDSILPILADALEEGGATFESDHLRVGHHSPACPVILKIMKETR